ncbi:MAG: L-serine ammonia-lyase, iron-sulfur-dependent, subunit alpha [Culicoidibacterales bacterium]
MQSLRQLYKIGRGPSSSHTMGPERAALNFQAQYPQATAYRVHLYGSLAATGVGHLTDWIIHESLKPKQVEIVWQAEIVKPFHTNAMEFVALDAQGCELGSQLYYSVGGGDIVVDGQGRKATADVYPFQHFKDMTDWASTNQRELWELVSVYDDADIWVFLQEVWDVMKSAVEAGLQADGVLPGTLQVQRKAKMMYEQALIEKNPKMRENKRIAAYAYAVSEQNADGGTIVTAPTCGACGVLPAVLYYLAVDCGYSNDEILKGLAVAGLVGNTIKQNASISGAEAGCQAEVGSACSMAAAAYAQMSQFSFDEIDTAAEIAMEHHLGLTCDPVSGFVQIPCIERNAVAALRALDAAMLASVVSDSNHLCFDQVVYTMLETGKDLNEGYRETSILGLAKFYSQKQK